MSSSIVIAFQGHADIRASDPRSIEILDSDSYAARPGVIGYHAMFDPLQVARARGRVRITISCGQISDALEATLSPLFVRGAPLVLRRDPAARAKSLAQASSKAASDLHRDLIAALRGPDASATLTITPLSDHAPSPGVLHLVAMPIGRQDDLSPRALDVLMSVDAIYAEDTRIAQDNLSWRGVRTPLISCHEHSQKSRAGGVAERLKRGDRLAYVSDAGAPIVSDPGAALVRAALDVGAIVTTAPGPSAVIAALSISGLAKGPFRFAGFAPRAGRERSVFLAEVAAGADTQILFESPHRLAALLSDLAALAPDRAAALCKDLTKQTESVSRAPLGQLSRDITAETDVRGEYVLVLAGLEAVDGPPPDQGADLDAFIRALIDAQCPTAPIVKAVRAVTGQDRTTAYARVAALKERRD
jgi:16S rRNA (cytidine1402-2'-O)-methyltransferase